MYIFMLIIPLFMGIRCFWVFEYEIYAMNNIARVCRRRTWGMLSLEELNSFDPAEFRGGLFLAWLRVWDWSVLCTVPKNKLAKYKTLFEKDED